MKTTYLVPTVLGMAGLALCLSATHEPNLSPLRLWVLYFVIILNIGIIAYNFNKLCK